MPDKMPPAAVWPEARVLGEREGTVLVAQTGALNRMGGRNEGDHRRKHMVERQEGQEGPRM